MVMSIIYVEIAYMTTIAKRTGMLNKIMLKFLTFLMLKMGKCYIIKFRDG